MNNPGKIGRLKALLFACAAVLLALGLAEGLLRALDLGAPPEERMYTDIHDVRYRLKPGAPNPCPTQQDRINSRGTRGPEFGEDKPPGKRRVLCLGDSTTFGWNLQVEQSYPAQLQRLLDEAAPGRFEVINGGIPGTNSYQHRLYYEERALRWRPDAVVWRVEPNGRDDIMVHRQQRRTWHGRLVQNAGRTLAHSRLYRTLRLLIKGGRPAAPPRILGQNDDEQGRRVEADYAEDLSLIGALAARDGFTPLWLNVPGQELVEQAAQWLAEHPGAGRAEFEEHFRPLDITTAEFTAARGLPYVDTLWEFTQSVGDPLLFVDPGHPGELGQRICARRVFAALRAARVLDF